MKKNTSFFILIIGFAAAGCVNTQQEQLVKDLKAQLAEVEKRQTKTEAGLEQLGNKFLLLQEQLAENQKDIKEVKTMALPVAPPEELKVIKLPPEEPVVEAKKEQPKKEEVKIESKKTLLPGPEGLYNEAQDLFMAGRISESIEKFTAFIQNYPKHTLADNAQYWIGEAYYSQKDYQKALAEFTKVLDKYPGENKAPDALLKMAYAHLELNNKDKAMELLRVVMDKYPSSEASVKARTKLQEIQK